MSGARRGASAAAAFRPRAGDGVRIRRARLDEARAIAAVMRAAIRGLAAPAHPAAHVAAWSSLPALYHRWAMTAGGERYFVALRAGKLAGYAARRGAEVTALFVRPATARQGVGSALLTRVERDARDGGVSVLRADAARAALAFYVARGFRPDRALRVPLPGGARLAARRVVKRLT